MLLTRHLRVVNREFFRLKDLVSPSAKMTEICPNPTEEEAPGWFWERGNKKTLDLKQQWHPRSRGSLACAHAHTSQNGRRLPA